LFLELLSGDEHEDVGEDEDGDEDVGEDEDGDEAEADHEAAEAEPGQLHRQQLIERCEASFNLVPRNKIPWGEDGSRRDEVDP
jgi:hypothetical protein